MTIAVSNTGPLIHLAQVNQLKLLFNLFSIIYIPQAVYIEAVEEGLTRGYPDALAIDDEINNSNIIIKSVDKTLMGKFDFNFLHKGEIEAITLAMTLHSNVILLDDEEARTLARKLNLRVKGTLGILIQCTEKGHVTQKKAVKILNELNQQMYLSSDVYAYVFERITEIQGKK